QGRLVGVCRRDDMSLIAGDVTSCFASAYDVSRVQRMSLLIGDDLVVVRDRVQAESSHKVSWRVHVRHGQATRDDDRFAVTSAEGVQLEVCVNEAKPLEHTEWQDRVKRTQGEVNLEASCHELTGS